MFIVSIRFNLIKKFIICNSFSDLVRKQSTKCPFDKHKSEKFETALYFENKEKCNRNYPRN